MKNRARPDRLRAWRALARLASAGPSGWWLLVQAQLSILAAMVLVRRHPQGELIGRLADGYSAPALPGQNLERAQDVALAIDRVARFGVGRPLCLVRSIALHRLLERRGIRGSRISVGVRMHASEFEAHAWVELAGQVVGDDPGYVSKFNHFSGLADAPLPRASRVVLHA